MDVKYKLCSRCGFSYINKQNSIRISSENFCSLQCVPQCAGCYGEEKVVMYCLTNSKYYCSSCEKKRCSYCNIFKIGKKCIKNCD
uniref:Uncharacterized protein n=1 Tax=viral metagenome TaxID=1070528 RepID=A0A6C0IJ10_9ZZZZ